jgi:hypothetical protein
MDFFRPPPRRMYDERVRQIEGLVLRDALLAPVVALIQVVGFLMLGSHQSFFAGVVVPTLIFTGGFMIGPLLILFFTRGKE